MAKMTLWNKIRLAWYYLMQGLVAGDKAIRSDSGTEIDPVGGIEQQKETQSVYKDLLKGEITQEVIELRHQMYFTERKSHEYEYNGGGHAKKKNSMFGYSGNVEQSDGYKVTLVQENKQFINSLDNDGVHIVKGDVLVDDDLKKGYNTTKNINAEYTIHCERDFMPRFRLESYATKIVVKDVDNEHAIVDIYVPQYRQQFKRTTNLLQAELDRIYQGNVRSDLVMMNKIWFKTFNCYGADDSILYEYDDVKFDNIIKFDGSYVLRFYCHILTNGEDEIQQYYDEKMAEKYENKERREGATVDFEAMAAIKAKEDLDVSEDIKLLNVLHKNEEATD